MSKPTDLRPVGAELWFLPVRMRMPIKFGRETVASITCARARLVVRDRQGRTAEGWGETPLSVTWAWPSAGAYEPRHLAMKDFCVRLADAWAQRGAWGHPIEIGHDFAEETLPALLEEFNRKLPPDPGPMPRLAALICASLFDLALHDAYGVLHATSTFATYTSQWMNRDLAAFLDPAKDAPADFREKYPADYLSRTPPSALPAWHLVGGVDPLDESDLTGHEPRDGYPALLREWIARDGLNCLKIKLRGNDAAWDFARIVRVGRIAEEHGQVFLSADFNCTVAEPAYVTEILDRLRREQPSVFASILYVEQPFPYDLEAHPMDVRAVSARKPLFLDESAHDWRLVRLGRELGWTGVALKTCKTQSGALLALCWAKAHGMALMVQDLTNPMLAMIPHALLAAHAGTIMGVETNAPQFYPEASLPEARIHPGLYRRRNGRITLETLRGPGFGYRLAEISRKLPEPAVAAGTL
ncbi:MAG: mandelate racemase/muconate lactonizing enzyme family protein [Verrucomicrobiae bacterium]|nr:mandelate racemase/muconate lactonizing enzyme family protein [Verrucomicrobiae bacterium]